MPVSNGVLRCHGPEALGQILWSLRRPRYYNRFSFFFSPLFIFLYCGVKALKLLVKYSGAFAAPRFPFFFRFQEDSPLLELLLKDSGGFAALVTTTEFPPLFFVFGIYSTNRDRYSPPSSLFSFLVATFVALSFYFTAHFTTHFATHFTDFTTHFTAH